MIGVCGHSLCKKCVCVPNKPTTVRPLLLCPLCRQKDAFKSLKTNFQMLDVMENLAKMRKIVAQLESDTNGGLKCHVCASKVEEKKARICEPCSLENESILVDEGIVVVRDLNKVTASVTCASCFLEGLHDGHKSHLFLPLKLRSRASTEYSTLREVFRVASFNMLEGNIQRMKSVVDSLDLPLSQLEKNGHLAGSSRGFDDILAKCQQQKAALLDIESELEGQIKKHLEKLEGIADKLKHAASYEPDAVLSARVNAATATESGGNERLIQLINNSTVEYVHFKANKPFTASLETTDGVISPGCQFGLVLSHAKSICQSKIMTKEVTVMYSTHSSRTIEGEPLSLDRQLVILLV